MPGLGRVQAELVHTVAAHHYAGVRDGDLEGLPRFAPCGVDHYGRRLGADHTAQKDENQ